MRGILHNVLYTDKVRHGDEVHPGLREALVSDELFQVVQEATRRNCGRSETVQQRPEREYLLKGLIQCAHCRMSMWAQTYKNGCRLYREHRPPGAWRTARRLEGP